MDRSPTRRLRRFAGLLTSALLVSAALAGCGSEEAPAAPTVPGAVPVEPAAFPVTIDHKYGSTEIKAEPKRIVTVGLTDQDALLSVGVVPVATSEFVGEFPGAIGPWATQKLNGAPLPEVMKGTTDPQFEKIASLRPDLILGLYSGMTQEHYDKLAKIAPTVAQPKEFKDYGVPWQESTRRITKAVGRGGAGEQIISEVDAKLAAVKQAHPEFAGKSALMATTYQGYFIYGSEDPRSRVLASLGFVLPPNLDQVIGDKFGANISPERTDLLNVDVLSWIVPGLDEGRATLDKDTLYSGMRVAQEKREVLIDEASPYGAGISFVSPLSVPWVVDRLVPQLTAAVDGNPATEVKPVTS
ncbi:iron-siderophore ABC transporter substrate-binding protein [Amycolatopsis sp. YIM 10]|uniref:iron-siderophore ABC transporter substrate-binding protein n=1 Tax=Amycolatopsis sp. YIM 10 TaxID=2653857 RepID=UPI00128FE9C8|nr:iron-siderophore ABC transporter substrate-binding protein [Amycolatopsis sp. YIM 10]QFU93180.1 Putative ABC transporter substrate-binding lipoprotein YhfQ precursor [Amycolatopsis sp. YIM 10]